MDVTVGILGFLLIIRSIYMGIRVRTTNYKRTYFKPPKKLPDSLKTFSENYIFQANRSQIYTVLLWPSLSLIFIALTCIYYGGGFYVLILIAGPGLLIRFGEIIIGSNTKVLLKGNQLTVQKLGSSISLDLQTVNHIELSYYFNKSRGITFYPEFFFSYTTEQKNFKLSGVFFLGIAPDLLSTLRMLFPEKTFTVRWYDFRKGTKEIMALSDTNSSNDAPTITTVQSKASIDDYFRETEGLTEPADIQKRKFMVFYAPMVICGLCGIGSLAYFDFNPLGGLPGVLSPYGVYAIITGEILTISGLKKGTTARIIGTLMMLGGAAIVYILINRSLQNG